MYRCNGSDKVELKQRILWWGLALLGLLMVLVVALLLLASTDDGGDKKVVRLEKFSTQKPYITQWRDKLIWVIKRPPSLVEAIYRKRGSGAADPRAVFRSTQPEVFVVALAVTEQDQVKIKNHLGESHVCKQFDYRAGDSADQMFRCELGDGEIYFDAVGESLDAQWQPLEIPPYYFNKQRQLVIGAPQ